MTPKDRAIELYTKFYKKESSVWIEAVIDIALQEQTKEMIEFLGSKETLLMAEAEPESNGFYSALDYVQKFIERSRNANNT